MLQSFEALQLRLKSVAHYPLSAPAESAANGFWQIVSVVKRRSFRKDQGLRRNSQPFLFVVVAPARLPRRRAKQNRLSRGGEWNRTDSVFDQGRVELHFRLESPNDSLVNKAQPCSIDLAETIVSASHNVQPFSTNVKPYE